jgi:hypothetical protein
VGWCPEEDAGMSDMTSPSRYEIRVDAVLDSQWESWFEGLAIGSDGRQTTISGPLVDQAALHGVLIKVRDLGIPLLSVRRLEPD